MKRIEFLKLMPAALYSPNLINELIAQMHLDSSGSTKIIDQNSIQSPSECNCSEALDMILNYTKLLRMYDTEERVVTNFNYNKNINMFSVDRKNNSQILNHVIQAIQEKLEEKDLKEICPSILKTYDGYRLNAPEFIGILGEPLQDPCFVNYVSQVAKRKGLKKVKSEEWFEQTLNFGITTSFVEETSQNHKLNYKLFKDQCEIKADNNTFVDLYNIPLFNCSRIEAFGYIVNNKSLPVIEKRKYSSTEALDIIDQQAKFWYNLVISLDSAYTIINSNDNDHPQRSFWIHASSKFIEFKKLMAFAAHILRTDGYLEKNIQAYKTKCISHNTTFKFNHPNDFNDFRELINSVHSKEIFYNLKFSMDAIAPHVANIMRNKNYSLFPWQEKSNLFRGE